MHGGNGGVEGEEEEEEGEIRHKGRKEVKGNMNRRRRGVPFLPLS